MCQIQQIRQIFFRGNLLLKSMIETGLYKLVYKQGLEVMFEYLTDSKGKSFTPPLISNY